MKAVYIGHSGTAVIFDDLVMIFDIEKISIPEEARDRPVIFFASHVHKDHFNPGILEFGKERSDVSYCLSWDILKENKKKEEIFEGLDITSVKPEMNCTVKAGSAIADVSTLRSTDRGVAFIIRFKDKVIYHSGDLNCWSWPGDTKQHRNQEIAEYRREIDKLKGLYIDMAFVPLDPRLEEDYRNGMEYFIENVSFGHIMPIHMWGGYHFIKKYKDTLEYEVKEKILETEYEGQCFEVR